MNMRKKLDMLLVVVMVCSLAWVLWRELSLGVPAAGEDQISLLEKRFFGVKAVIIGRGVIGYATDIPNDRIFSDGRAMLRYIMAQYAMAPVVVANTPGALLVVGDFFMDTSDVTNPSLKGLTMLKDFGGGVYLLMGKKR